MFWRRLAHGFRNCFRKGWFQRRKVKQMNNEIVPSFPDGKEFTLFRETHPNVLRSMDEVAGGYAQIMLAMEQLDSNRDNEILFLMVGACYTEYEEILLLWLNGYGSGGTKLLRALYERVVTVLYLTKNPQKIQQFIDYTHVHWNKLLIEADTNGVAQELNEERRKEIVTNFEAVKNQFSEPRCSEKTCKNFGKTQLQLSWTKKPVPTQAREVVPELGLLCFQTYMMPTFFLHTTLWGISQQIKEHENGRRELHNKEMERGYAQKAVLLSSVLMGHLASGLLEHFKFEMRETSERMMEAIKSIGRELSKADLESAEPPPHSAHPTGS